MDRDQRSLATADALTESPAPTQGGAGAPGLGMHQRDLAALLALPRVWRNRDPAYIGAGLMDVLVSLERLDVAYVRFGTGDEARLFEGCWPTSLGDPRALGASMTEDASTEELAAAMQRHADGLQLRTTRVTLRVDDESAVVVVGSRRADFPTEIESFLTRVAVEQAMIAVHASRLVESLKGANAAKATFLATMSHELRTPLNAIIGHSELVKARIAGELTVQQELHLERITVAARHLLELIEGILNFARLDAGQEQVHPADFDAAALMNDVVTLVEPLAVDRRIALTPVITERPIPLHTDPAKVRQILLNLLSNALKFTHDGRVSLQVWTRNADVFWCVTDTGVGIPAEDLERIFEPFRQSGAVHTHRAPGTGLGLSVSRQLARLLGGDVTVTSEMNRGSAFTVRIPARYAPPAHADPHSGQ